MKNHSELLNGYSAAFDQKKIAGKKVEYTSYQKMLAALRSLGTGHNYDDINVSSRMSEGSVGRKENTICRKIFDLYEREYLNRMIVTCLKFEPVTETSCLVRLCL